MNYNNKKENKLLFKIIYPDENIINPSKELYFNISDLDFKDNSINNPNNNFELKEIEKNIIISKNIIYTLLNISYKFIKTIKLGGDITTLTDIDFIFNNEPYYNEDEEDEYDDSFYFKEIQKINLYIDINHIDMNYFPILFYLIKNVLSYYNSVNIVYNNNIMQIADDYTYLYLNDNQQNNLNNNFN